MSTPLDQEPPGGDFASYVEKLVARSAAGLAASAQLPGAVPPVPGLQQSPGRRKLTARGAAPAAAPVVTSPASQPSQSRQQAPLPLPVPTLAKVLPWMIGSVIAAFVILSIGGWDGLYVLVFIAAIALQLILRKRRK